MISRGMSPLIGVISIVVLLITLFITTHEPPSSMESLLAVHLVLARALRNPCSRPLTSRPFRQGSG